MRKTQFLYTLVIGLLLSGCGSDEPEFDATGTFEADEVIVSSELGGRIDSFTVEEGQQLAAGKVVGAIDAQNLVLQKEQVEASIEALQEKTLDVQPQIELLWNQLKVQKAQLAALEREQKRTQNLIAADAATGKQLDDINSQIDVLKGQMEVTQQQINVQRTATYTQNRGILSENKPLQKRVAQLENQLDDASITNPVSGTVLSTYAEEGEITAPGKPLYKIADLSTMTLRAYITGSQLPQVRLGQQVNVFVDQGEGYKELPGTITWVSDKAEFTPKTIQTKEERANLVYAIKVRVKNDGYLKVGMYGEVRLSGEGEEEK
ncbi:HlyD family efflux transporter periplasmic adaptor subunit [Pontibacter sp. E15-1]|uniref:HlyD family secretion protein n=1 Tax=Pontibacter sp. E15-1 TaxID=2919918 RepID=UPI001F4F937B|nr:HlyD family efflux transporter periplasmic adaptor subunit [Pontibacter sp. E15-1]MCJ8163262.1 HlyD family efflux transporter periplasmic adaptor subunit [Pontibacter sp. E15-1]